ncbi:MAG: SpoIID/LytB domain-containing protein, partial [Solirubrobacterales bacterium]
MIRKFKFKLLSIAACLLMLSTNVVVGQAASTIQDNYAKKIAIGLTSLNNISTLDFTVTDNYYIQENNIALNKGSKYNITLSNSIFVLTQDGKQICSLDTVTICPNSATSYISFKKDTWMRYFSGSLTFNKLTPNTFIPINKLGIEDYVKGVVPYECSESYPIEALKVQAVSARTYALANLGRFSA